METILDLNYTSENAGNPVNGLVLVNEVSFKPRKNDPNKSYVNGVFKYKNKTFSFRAFDDNLVSAFKKENLVGRILLINGSIDDYKGYLSIIIKSITFVENVDKSLFVDSHDINKIFNEFNEYLKSTFSEEEFKLINAIFASAPDGFQRFIVEQAGKSWHDSCGGGLMYHTLKMLKICDFMLNNDYRMTQFKEKLKNFEKLLKLGIILHDIGKVVELHDGQYTPQSIVSHRVRAVEYCAMNKKAIVELYGEDGYDLLLTGVSQHHGTFEGEAPSTVFAYLLHAIDMFDSQTTHILEGVLADNNVDSDGRYFVRYDDLKLYY